jgi:hypothetical protein
MFVVSAVVAVVVMGIPKRAVGAAAASGGSIQVAATYQHL